MYTHRGAYLNALGELIHSRITSDAVYPLDPADVSLQRLVLHLGPSPAVGGTHVCLRKVDPAVVWGSSTEGVTHSTAPPPCSSSLANHPLRQPVKLHAAVDRDDGGAPPSPTLIAQMRRSASRSSTSTG